MGTTRVLYDTYARENYGGAVFATCSMEIHPKLYRSPQDSSNN